MQCTGTSDRVRLTPEEAIEALGRFEPVTVRRGDCQYLAHNFLDYDDHDHSPAHVVATCLDRVEGCQFYIALAGAFEHWIDDRVRTPLSAEEAIEMLTRHQPVVVRRETDYLYAYRFLDPDDRDHSPAHVVATCIERLSPCEFYLPLSGNNEYWDAARRVAPKPKLVAAPAEATESKLPALCLASLIVASLFIRNEDQE